MGSTGQIESETHLRDEYSTCDWIMEGLLDKAGFDVEVADRKDDFLATYVCTKMSLKGNIKIKIMVMGIRINKSL